MNKLKCVLIVLFFANSLFAQNTNRNFEGASLINGEQLEVKVNDGIYLIKFYSSEIVETTFIPSGQEFNKESHAVVLSSTLANLKLDEDESSVSFESNDLVVNIQKSPFQISYIRNGKPIISEKAGYSKIDNGESIQFNLDADEVLYGGGARALGMNRRGNRLELYNRAHYGYETRSELMNYSLPIVLSSNMYMVHFDNAPIGFLDLDSKKDNTLTYETISGRKTYQVIVGETWLEIIDNYTDLTGKQPLPPRWAFGNFASRFGYHSKEEVFQTINKFKEEKIPVDAVIIDIYWFGKEIKGHMGNLEFLRDSFPDPKLMIRALKFNGIKTVLVTEPFILTTSKRWQEAVDKDILAKDSLGAPFKYDFYFGNTGLIDVYDKKGKDWFWNIYKGLADMGVKGVWGDLGEPEVHPSDLLHATGTADEVHNTYGHDWARLIFEGYQKDFPEERPFILMRAGASGSQRFGLIPWSGDVNRTWGGLQSQTEIALQMGMQGLGYMHSDLGGFAGANLDDELYTRWLQYGVFQPIFRPHAQEEVPSEPIFREPKTKALAKRSIELRYKLLPYNYTLAFENSTTGAPFMRPLFFLEQEDNAQLVNANTYLWGNDFLITPVVNPGVSEKEVNFPKNNVWFDFYSDEKVIGGQTRKVLTKANSIPTFIKAGAFIPMAKAMLSTDNYDANKIDLHYYHDSTVSEGEGQLYNDDGLISEAYNKGSFELLQFESEFYKRCLEFEFESVIGSNFNSQKKQIELIVHNIPKMPKRIKVNGKKVNFNWNSEQKTVSVPISWNPLNELKINIKLKM